MRSVVTILISCGGSSAEPPVVSQNGTARQEVEAPAFDRPPRVAIEPSEAATAIAAAKDRLEGDREVDGRRHPTERSTFLRLESGMRVA